VGVLLRDRSDNPAISRIHRAGAVGEDRDDVERLTLGAWRSTRSRQRGQEPSAGDAQSVAKILSEGDKAELASDRSGRDGRPRAPAQGALPSIEELSARGPGYKRDVSLWGQIGQGALALG